MRFLLQFATGVAGLLLLSMTVASAAPPSYCRSYARTASNQYQESRLNGCGLFGGRWQESLDAHYDWCLGSSVDDVETEQEYRDRELRTCRRNLPPEPPSYEDTRRDDCRTYARVAAQQNEAQELLGCGFRGGRWQSNEINHFNWCVSVSRASSDRQNADRARDVQVCKRERDVVMKPQQPRFGFSIELNFGDKKRSPSGPKVAFCRNYASEAVRQTSRQEYLGCGYFGNRWNPRAEPHFNFCMSNDKAASVQESSRRKAMLASCQ